MAWNQPSAAQTEKGGGQKKPRMMRGIIAGAIVAVGAAAALWMLRTPSEKPAAEPVEKAVQAISEKQPEKPAAELTPGKQIAEIIRKRHGRKNLTAEDKREIAVLRAQMASNAAAKAVSSPGVPKRRSPFTCRSDQVIAMVLTAGDKIPPFPGTEADLEKEFVRSLNTPIEIKDDDSDHLKQIKQMVIDARAEIDAQMKEGRGFREILEEHRQQVAENAALRREVKEMAKQMMAEGDGEMVDTFLEKANKQLSDSGVQPVERPLTKEERQEIFRQRRLERQNQQKEQK